MTVIDASVLVAAAVDAGPDGAWAEGVVARGALVAPHLLIVEATNVLRRLEIGNVLTRLEATAASRDLLRLDVELLPFEPFAERVWELRSAVTSTNAWYVAMAEGFEAPLATLDTRLARAKGPHCSFLLPG